ncbi:PHD finger protein 21A [Hondaea fermentalgiana]|uniref:PHD finger protein 21A n=1 Tax=Hondaea fermentalgiana TaxID=2315210 RepID=A0A2R5GP42_9STRA|nr:PHD finger protein 21A [Hondaea fermentalgiana]|eukprot:GBG32642.1 PHD finger protein 21A [Hondaea fermentalgiana]
MGGATGSGGEVKAGLLDFLPPAGALPAVIRRALAPATEDAAAAAGSTPRSLTRKGKSEDAARRLKSKLGHLVGFEFETCPPFNKKHFRPKTKSSEENERAKRLAAESIAAGNAEKERMQRSLWFTRAQDNALVRGVERYGLGDWGAVIESDPVFAGLECPLEALPVRFAVLKEAFHGDDEILVARNIDGEEGVLLKIEKGARGRPRVASVGIKSENEDFCSLCEQGGDLLLCDGCPRSYHLPCLGIEEPPEEDEWFCPECLANAKDIVDDSELDDRSWRDYIKVFMDVGTAKASSEERNAEFLESQDGEEIEGIVTQTLKRMVQAPDADFEKITREIEGLSGFVSENIPKAESKLLQQFVDRYETELKGRSDKRQDGKPGGGPEDDEEEDDDDDEEDDEEEDDEEEDEDDDVDEEDEEDDDEEDDDDDDDEEDDDEEDDEEDDGMVREDDEEDDDDPPIPEVAESDLDSDTDNEGSRAGVTASSGSRGPNKREASGSGSRRSGGGTGIIDAGDEEEDDDDEGAGSGHNSDARRKAKRPRMSSSPRHKTSAGAEASTKKTAAAWKVLECPSIFFHIVIVIIIIIICANVNECIPS